ncbi:1-acyl-sn-glycerol-3-phosphate acyltransferase [Candidatus Sulfidibacterium hydrothermale]|uniref:1-acyl-sn-glycerol-3-phosphate acyltransferase n=1 Tax=Candidatus Sulfidibacterium hydrothermale TaxID=2875962 RepID=UPI001F0A57D4|nr:1-acyl-sn-glycerol-3-phosphate acyltransferase [Candidatus Sulfidibacterium hydrothermale]UBM61800.1 1-acyl-sn-glycerol-3-phosphate acyltransferase [Candidatus Sulfidibacterium hydrothermale]
MGVENIEKYSRSYAALKTFLRFWHDKIFYRKVVYVNREKLPLNEHLIFTPNHQNALMDALAIEFSLSNQFVFVARSDIFKNKQIARILYFLKILPVYRIRDGYDSLKKNELTFRKTLDIIRNKNGFVILPEGNHAGFRKLRSLKKGFARIAFQAEEAENFLLDMKIVPVGINYSDYENFRSDLLVIFGKPFAVSEFYEVYKENPAVAYNRIKEKLAREMKPLMINIESQYYDAVDFLRKAYRRDACRQLNLDDTDLYHQFRAEKEIIARLNRFEQTSPDKMKRLAEKVQHYRQQLKTLKIPDVQPATKGRLFLNRILLLLGFPFFLYGYLNHFFPWNICIATGNKIKDPQFRSSFKFVLSFITFPLFYLIQILLVQWGFHRPVITILYAVTLPFFAAFSWNYARLYRKTVALGRYWRNRRKKNRLLSEAEKLYAEIMEETGRLFHSFS